MPTIQELREKRTKCVADARAIAAKAEKEKRGLNAEESKQVDDLLKASDEARDQERALEVEERRASRLSEHEEDLTRSAGRRAGEGGDDDPEDPDEPGDRGRRSGRGRARGDEGRENCWRVASGAERRVAFDGPRSTPKYRAAFRQWMASGQVGRDLVEFEKRDLVADADPQGGYMVAPMQMLAGLLKFADDRVFIRQYATVIPVTAAQSLGVVSLEADPEDGEWTSEVSTGSADTSMRFGGRELSPQPLSKEVLISRKLLRLAPNVESLVMQRLAYKFGLTQEKSFLTGSGANQPLGLFTAHASGISTARDVSTGNTTTAITADGLIRAKMSLKIPYRSKARWLFHRDGVTQIMLLKDGNGQYIWRQGLVAGEPDLLLGLPIDESEHVPNTFTTGLYVGLIGDFSYYWIAEQLRLEVQRLDELYAKQNKVSFLGRMELDGMPVLEEAFTRVKLG